MKVSIITINLNDAIGLEKTILSVIHQTYTKFEFIVIDGGSTDKSIEVINQYSNKISYWISEPDSGIYNAMNKGIQKACGDYCLFLNSGDVLVNNNIIAEVFKNNYDEDILYGSIVNDFITYKQTVEYPDIQYLTFRHFLTSSLPHPSTFIKLKLIHKIGYYDETLKIVSDWKFFIVAIFKFNASIKKVNSIISEYNLQGVSSKNSSQERILIERQKVLNDDFPLFINDYKYLTKIENTICIRFWFWLKKIKRWINL